MANISEWLPFVAVVGAVLAFVIWIAYRVAAGKQASPSSETVVTDSETANPKRRVEIERGSASRPDPDPADTDFIIEQCGEWFDTIEEEVVDYTLNSLKNISDNRNRTLCDKAFGYFTHCLLFPYAERGLVSRAAEFATMTLIPKVLQLESQHTVDFHKGALFYDTSLAYLAIGDEARFEYFLAMASEEDYETHAVENKPRQRGMHSLKRGELSRETIEANVQFATDLLNGVFSTSTVIYAFVFGGAITTQRFDHWRQTLDPLHHAELFRFLYESEVFLGRGMPNYKAVLDNPYVMLRLVKSLAHAAQWIESRLSLCQDSLPAGTISRPTLSFKLQDDPDLAPLVTAAGSGQQFSGSNPRTATDVATQLRTLLADIPSQATDEEKEWRILRIFYIVRNATAHEIEEALAFHSDRALLTELLQVVFIGCFVIEKRKL